MTAPEFSKKLLRVLLALALLIAGALGIFVWWLEKIYLDPGPFHREQMTAIVEEIRHRQFDEGSEIWFHIKDFNHPKSITETGTGGMPINIWAVREADGDLKVSIMTADRGHLGDYGFAYSDQPMTAATTEAYRLSVEALGGMRHVLRKIDDHWWAVEDNTR